MESLDQLVAALPALFTWQNILFLLIGVGLGAIVGILPGIGPTAGIAILIPLTIGMDPTTAIIMLAAIYYGAMYGGSITAILLNVPGESASVAATLDGYPLAQQGRAGPAMVMQAASNFIGGIIGVILLTLLVAPIGRLARQFGPSELLLLVLIGLVAIVGIVGKDKLKGVISALFGFALGSVGVDLASGASRFTFGEPGLLSGVSFVAVVIGLFGIGEILSNILDGEHKAGGTTEVMNRRGSLWPNRKDWSDSKFTFGRASLVGFLVGVVPGAGASVASFISYAFEQSVSKVKAQFGKGAMPGLVSVEAAVSASTPGAMVPMLTLGVPGSAATAVLLGAFVLWGLTPGPLMMVQHPDVAWGLVGSMYLGNVALLLLCVAAIPLFVMILRVPYALLVPAIVILCAIGTYAVGANFTDVIIMAALGAAGLLMKRYGYSPAAAVVAFVLGPMAEKSLRQTIIISTNDPTFILGRPYSVGMAILLILLVGVLIFTSVRRDRREHEMADSSTDSNEKDFAMTSVESDQDHGTRSD